MIVQEKIFGKYLINTLSHEVGSPLCPLGYFIEKMEEGHTLTREEIKIMSDAQERIKWALNSFRKMANSNFNGIIFSSDKHGLICQIELQDDSK